MTHSIISGLLGVLVFTVNFYLLSLAWNILIFHKKFIALALPLIVFKYAILGVSLYYAMHSAFIDSKWFVAGIAVCTLVVPFKALLQGKKKDQS